ncbi:MAG: hypothetical protein AB7G36_18855 [Candidatus Nanopelagicales bacterium]
MAGPLGSLFKSSRSVWDDFARLLPRGVKTAVAGLIVYDVAAPVAEDVTGIDLPGGGVILRPLVDAGATAVGDSLGRAQAKVATSYANGFLEGLGVDTTEKVGGEGGVRIGTLLTVGILGLAAFAVLQAVRR